MPPPPPPPIALMVLPIILILSPAISLSCFNAKLSALVLTLVSNSFTALSTSNLLTK